MVFFVKMESSDQDIVDTVEEFDPTLLSKYQFQTYQPEQSLCKLDFDTKHHRNNHTCSSSKSDVEIDFGNRLLDAFCNENVINQIVNNLMKKD